MQAALGPDIDPFIDGVPDDHRIAATLDLTRSIEGADVAPGRTVAKARTAERWERIMRQRDDGGSDTLLTTRRHIENWRLTEGQVCNCDIT